MRPRATKQFPDSSAPDPSKAPFPPFPLSNTSMSRKSKDEHHRFFTVSESRTHEKGHTEYKVTARVGSLSIFLLIP